MLFLVLLGCASTIGAQIVNIERERIATGKDGWFGSANLAFAGTKNTKSAFTLEAGGTLEYKRKRNLFLFLSEFALITGDGEKFANAGFGHLRYNYKLSDSSSVRWEVFTQVQYNGLTKIDTRALWGTGPRFELTKDKNKARFFYAIAYMYEYQELVEPFVYKRDHRISSYFSFTLKDRLKQPFKIISTTYAQPLIKDFSDYRIMNETTLKLKITERLSLNLTVHYNYNAVPPAGVPSSTYYFRNGLEMTFYDVVRKPPAGI